jgi:sulfite reductase (NADPH) hemoprotein beta-component
VVDPYLADVSLETGAPVPTHFREVYRTRGPSNRPDLGRQAESL